MVSFLSLELSIVHVHVAVDVVPPQRREARPEQQRHHEPDHPDDQQDDADRVEADPRHRDFTANAEIAPTAIRNRLSPRAGISSPPCLAQYQPRPRPPTPATAATRSTTSNTTRKFEVSAHAPP